MYVITALYSAYGCGTIHHTLHRLNIYKTYRTARSFFHVSLVNKNKKRVRLKCKEDVPWACFQVFETQHRAHMKTLLLHIWICVCDVHRIYEFCPREMEQRRCCRPREVCVCDWIGCVCTCARLLSQNSIYYLVVGYLSLAAKFLIWTHRVFDYWNLINIHTHSTCVV